MKSFSLGDDEPKLDDDDSLLDDSDGIREGDDSLVSAKMPVPVQVAGSLKRASKGDEPALRAQRRTALPAPALPGLDRSFAAAMAKAAERSLKNKSVAALAKIANDRFYKERPPADENSRVTRGWLSSLNQREFFLAIGYPGRVLYRKLDGQHSLPEIRQWVDGYQIMPHMQRKVLTLEHLLDRRTLSNRAHMPRREQIEAALAKMPRTTAVSAVLGGFQYAERFATEDRPTPTEGKPDEVTIGEVESLLRVVKPGEAALHGIRPGSKLPLSKRSQGKGRPLGGMLQKPDSYCYTISKRSVDKVTGKPRIKPHEVMVAINRAAELESRYKVYYSLRRRDPTMPWAPDNIEVLPTEELERQRGQGGEA